MSRPPISDEGLTLHATECGELEAGPHGITLVFTEDRKFNAEGPTERKTVARIAISAPAAAHMVNKLQGILAVLGDMAEAGSKPRN